MAYNVIIDLFVSLTMLKPNIEGTALGLENTINWILDDYHLVVKFYTKSLTCLLVEVPVAVETIIGWDPLDFWTLKKNLKFSHYDSQDFS